MLVAVYAEAKLTAINTEARVYLDSPDPLINCEGIMSYYGSISTSQRLVKTDPGPRAARVAWLRGRG